MKKIALIGYMASGKSTLAPLLAHQNNLKFIDLDNEIEESESLTIQQIFEQKGEIYFRKLEMKIMQNVVNQNDHFILSLGGGTPCFGHNMQWLLDNGVKLIYLKANPKTIYNRVVENFQNRPLIKDIPKTELLDFITKHLFERNYYYNQAQYKVDVSNKSLDEVLQACQQLIQDILQND